MLNMTTKTDKFNWFYYRQSDGCEDKFICQYLRLDYLLQLLETGKYYVRRRKYFEDANEKYYKSLKFMFVPVPFGENVISQPKSIERIIPYTKIVDCPTSCWSKRKEENYLMWKCYATEMGACIRTTTHNFIASLKQDFSENSENLVICGSMDYKKLKPSFEEEKQLFDKDKAYSEEKEFRFYFHLPSCDTNKDEKGILVPVDTKVMIDDILISPFMCKDAADKLARMIKCAYGIEAEQSRIKIK